MSRQRQYLDIDVLTAAKDRIRHIHDLFDTVCVCFSGGKDSLVTLHLAREIAKERGQDVIDVVFRDEELIPDEVIDFVDSYRKEPWVRMAWYCVPLKSTKYILGRTFDYVQWDPKRAHVRPMPEWGITLPAGDTRVFDQYTMDAFSASRYRGKIAFLTGIRAAESLIRYRASVNKLNENYINASSSANVALCKPLYDWEESDVFKFFFDRGIRYCSIYDKQVWSGSALRVATPLHAEAAKKLHQMKQYAPSLYDRMMQVFPEALVQERYYASLDRDAVVRQYGQSLEGVRSWIEDNIEEEGQRALALHRLHRVVIASQTKAPSYPPAYVLKAFMGGQFKRGIQPMKASSR